MNATSQLHPTQSDSTRHNQELVARIEKSQLFRDYRSAFETATGLPLTIRAAGAFQPPLSGSKQINPFCALIDRNAAPAEQAAQQQQQ